MLYNEDIIKISDLKNGFNQRWLEPEYFLGVLRLH